MLEELDACVSGLCILDKLQSEHRVYAYHEITLALLVSHLFLKSST